MNPEETKELEALLTALEIKVTKVLERTQNNPIIQECWRKGLIRKLTASIDEPMHLLWERLHSFQWSTDDSKHCKEEINRIIAATESLLQNLRDGLEKI